MDNYQDDIERYLRGELSPAQRHALEKKALNDPFLMDALEGAEMAASSFSSDVDTLRAKLERKSRPSLSWYGWTMRVAAGLVLLALISGLLYFIFPNRQVDTLALQEEKVFQEDISKDKNQGIAPENEAEKAVEPIQDTTPSKNEMNRDQSKPSRTASSTITTEPPTLAMAEHPAEEIEEEVIEIVETPSVESVASDKAMERMPPIPVQEKMVAKREMSDRIGYKVVQGRVTDDHGQVIPGVNIILGDEDQGTFTDAEGKYTIRVLDSTANLVFSFIGMETIVQSIPQTGELNVSLEPDISSLSEVVVVGYGTKSSADEIPTYEFASPEGGRGAYKQYLSTNIKYPIQAIENNVEGRVTVQFNVDSHGNTTDFRVIRGIGYGCDEEVIRLIKEGPKWSSSKRDGENISDRVRVRVRFKLPKK